MRLLPHSRVGRYLLSFFGLLLCGLAAATYAMIAMPGSSFAGKPEALEAAELEARDRLRLHVEALATEIVARHTGDPEALEDAASYLREYWIGLGYAVAEQEYVADGVTVRNLEVELRGSELPDEIVLVGAHYDSAHGWSGADDNASGVSALLELSRSFSMRPAPRRTLRFVAFTNEEPPHFQQETMGSLVYAKRSKERGEDICAMLSLETIAYFSDEAGSQQYPRPLDLFYGDRGNFIGIVGDTSARSLVHDVIASFREHASVPSEGIAAPTSIPGIGWSDHWSFSEQGYPAVMITDTAPFRNPHYHKPSDTADTLDFETLTRVVRGVEFVVTHLAN